jgi:hypothetical protein
MESKPSRRSSLSGLIGAGVLFSATPSAVGQSFSVDFGNDQGEVTHAMSGWLYSWWHTRESPAHANLEVNATSWRVGYWGTWDYEYQPMLDAGIGHVQIIMSDVFRNRGTGNWGGFAHDPSWQSLSYPETVAKTVELVNKNNWDKIAFDLINEPDAFGGETGGSDWFNNAWVPAFRKVRELRPQAEIVGPGFFSPNLAHMRTFLEKAKAANVVPDIISQHLLDSGSNSVVSDFDTSIRGLLDEYGLAQRPISFNEYINPGNVRFVQRRIETISQGERVNVHSAMHSSWDDSGELPPWNSTGDWPSLDGILSIPAEQERAPYWVYKFYGDMSGRRVWTSGDPNAWEGMATMDLSDPGKPVARFMLGGSNAGSNVTVNLNNIPAAFGSPVDVLIERVHTSGNEDLWRSPILHSRQNRTVTNGSLSFSLSGLPWGVAVMVTVKRSDLPAEVAKPMFNPVRGAYWKPIEVTLSTATSGATIRYTLDGSEPTASSPVYTGPIDVPVTKHIRAAAFKAGMAPSEVANGGFRIYKYTNGVYGEYFANTTLSGEPVLTRGDRQVNQGFGGARWDASLPHANFSSRWTGRLRPAHTGSHQLHIDAIDGARLWVDGNLLIDEWRVQSRRTHSVAINLIGGRDYDIRMEHYDGSGGDKIAILKWTRPGGVEEVIPSARLYPPTAPSGPDLLIPAGTTWKYLAPSGPGDAPPAGWQAPAFDDSAWSSGPARIGYGNQGEMTVVPTTPYRPQTLYFRRSFTVADPSALAATLRLQLLRDDGAVLYLNGEELLRDNMPEGEIGYGTFATAAIGSAWRGMPVRYLLPREKLLSGANTIAVEVHNASASGSDIGFDLWLFNPTRVTIPELGPIANHQAIRGVPMPPISFSVNDGEVPASSLTTSATSSNPGLIPNETIKTWGWGRSRLLSFTPNAGQTGTAQIAVTVNNGLETSSRNFTVTVVEPPVNTPPTIGPIANRTIPPDQMSNEIRFDVADGQTEPGLLVVTATSSNQALIPNDRLYINGTGDWRTLSIRPITGGTGSSVITLTVSDGELSATRIFTATVSSGAGPMLSCNFDGGTLDGWTDLTPSNTNTGPRNWALSPPSFPGVTQSGAGAIGQNIQGGTQDSSHPTLRLRSPEFSLNGAGGLNVWLRGGAGTGSLAGTAVSALPANSASPGFQGIALRNATTGQYVLSARKGSSGDDWQQVGFTTGQLATLDQNARYTLDLIDQGHGGWGWVAMDSVTIPGTTDAANTAPTISTIADQSIAANSNTGPLAFTVGDAESDPASLTLAAASSNPTLVPSANIVFGGSGANRSVTVTPAANQSGTATITLTVSDGELGTDESFLLTVLSDATPITFGFDDGTLQGWTLAATDSQGRQFFALVPPSVSSPHTVPHAGTHFIGLHIPAFGGSPFYFQDSAHDTLVLRSPEFTLNGAGDLSAWLCGGGTGSPSLAGTAVSALPAATSSGGFRGIALRNATTGQFALSASKSSDGNTWQQVGFSAAQLAALPQGHIYTLDFIDGAHGGWAWVNMDSVTIPGNQVAPPNPYLDWTTTKGLSGPAAAFDVDPDGDGLSNGIEFVLGGEPNPANPGWNSLALLPTAVASGDNLVFTYRRAKQAAYLNPAVEFSAGLVPPWTTAVHGSNATIIVNDDGDFDIVTATIPKNGAPTLFARLKVMEPAP